MPILCNTQTTVERQYFSVMKKHITWNSAQTWLTKIVKNHGLVHRQPSAYHAKPGSECYDIGRFIGIIAEWSEYCTLLAVRWLSVLEEQYKEFALINHRQSSNLGFLTLHAAN